MEQYPVRFTPDGSFTGDYHDSDMGSNSADHPNGTCYVSLFEGRFADIQQISDHSWSMRLADLTTERVPEEIWVEDGVRYIASSTRFSRRGNIYPLCSWNTSR